jgi:hypothetical protein
MFVLKLFEVAYGDQKLRSGRSLKILDTSLFLGEMIEKAVRKMIMASVYKDACCWYHISNAAL